MLLVAPVRERAAHAATGDRAALSGIDKLNVPRSDDPRGHARRLLGARPDGRRERRTRASTALLERVRGADRLPGARQHVSFNVRGEPIVCTPGRRLPLLHAHRHGRASCWASFVL